VSFIAKNCGVGEGAPDCTPLARVLDLSGTNPPPPVSFQQPYLGTATGDEYGQWLFIDVLAVRVAE
jgi:hypothetical protein